MVQIQPPMVGETSDVTPAIRLIIPNADATPDPELYFGISFCLLTLSKPKVSPHKKSVKPAKVGSPANA